MITQHKDSGVHSRSVYIRLVLVAWLIIWAFTQSPQSKLRQALISHTERKEENLQSKCNQVHLIHY